MKKGIDKMTWYKIIDWKYEYNNGRPKFTIVQSEKIFVSEISDIVYEQIDSSVINNMINDYYGDVEICGNKYPASLALKSTDALVYDEMKNDCCEIKIEEIIDEMPGKPATYHEMIDQCKIYWE